MPLALPTYGPADLGHVECLTAPVPFFRKTIQHVPLREHSSSWYRHALLSDGSTYVRWDGVGEFVVNADGRRILCRRADEASSESFQVYLLGQALSFALVKQRLEPLHATAVIVNGEAVAFLGGNAFGKSTLAACFVKEGCRLLTDDLLIVQTRGDGTLVYPGPARIKLFAKAARRLLGESAAGSPMNGGTDKLILPLNAERSCAEPVRLKAIYALDAPRDACRLRDVSIVTLSPREAFVALVKGTFNRRFVSADRLESQFRVMASVAEQVTLKRLAYPRAIERLQDVRRTVLADVQ